MLDDPTFATGMRLMSKGMTAHYREPDEWARVQVFEAWGISPDEQVALERHMQQFELSPERVLDEIHNDTPLLTLVLP